MIPKIIHYCWFGYNPLPELAKKCIASWEKFCPDYEILRWDESNFDLSACPLYVRQAYETKKWSFVTDYVRLKVVHDHGGIYMDTDVELVRSLDKLLEYSAYFGFEDSTYVNTGLGFGAEKGQPLLKELMEDYDGVPFVREDGSFDLTPCPKRNTKVLLRYGLVSNGCKQVLEGNIFILPVEYLCPLDFATGWMHKTRRTVSIHWFSASWHMEQEKIRIQNYQRQQRKNKLRYLVTHWPVVLLRNVIGLDRYLRIRAILRGESNDN